ncbi:MAG: hypothetical protein ABI988_17770 [Nitrospirota bacterium]
MSIFNFQGRSTSARGRTCADSLRALSLLLGFVGLAGLPGCLSFGSGDNSDTKASRNAAETAISREVAEMVKLYRVCLQKNEENPVKARENCGMYKDAIRDLAPDNMRTIVAEVLDRLRDKSQKPSNPCDIGP